MVLRRGGGLRGGIVGKEGSRGSEGLEGGGILLERVEWMD